MGSVALRLRTVRYGVEPEPSGSYSWFVYNLRFPGQYYDAETGLNYNYRRDYDPGIGRYIESDPIGLNGGNYSTYAYAFLNPLAFSDRTGLVPNPGEWTCVEPLQPICWAGIAADVATWALWGGSAAAGAVALATPGDTSTVTDPMQTAKGNVADTQIVKDYGEIASAAKLCGKGPPDRCEWLKQNASKYRRDQVIATQKAWGCRGSRAQK